MYLRWCLRPLYLHACQVRVTVGNSGLCCCTCVTSFEHQWTPLCVGSVESSKTSSLIRPLPILTGNRNAGLMSPVLIVAVLHSEVPNQWLGRRWRHISVFAWVERESERQREREREGQRQRDTQRDRERETQRFGERESGILGNTSSTASPGDKHKSVLAKLFRSSSSPACSTIFPSLWAAFSP